MGTCVCSAVGSGIRYALCVSDVRAAHALRYPQVYPSEYRKALLEQETLAKAEAAEAVLMASANAQVCNHHGLAGWITTRVDCKS